MEPKRPKFHQRKDEPIMPLKMSYNFPDHAQTFTCVGCAETKPRREVDEHGNVVKENFRDVGQPEWCSDCMAKRRVEKKESRSLHVSHRTSERHKSGGEGRTQ